MLVRLFFEKNDKEVLIVMSIFGNDDVVCVCCKERMKPGSISVRSGPIGVCRDCIKRFSPIPKENPIDGGAYVNYILSGFYFNDEMRKLLHRYKFGYEYKLGDLLAEMIYANIDCVSEIKSFDIATAIPLSRKRFFQREFNQSEILAENISKRLSIPFVKCVYRSRHTAAQSTLSARERTTNIINAFVADERKVKGKKILLFDDTVTTGATINECAHELKNKGATDIVGISVAKVGTKVYY